MGLLILARRRAAALMLVGIAAFAAGCDRVETESSGDVEYSWKPPANESVAGVPAAAINAAIAARLTGERPDSVSTDLWKHVQRLYEEYGGTALWMESDGPNETRSRALIKAIVEAHTDALRLDEYPIVQLARAVAAVRDAKPATAELIAEADVLLSSAYLLLAEDLLSGQLDPRALSSDWHIDYQHEKLDSAVVLSLRADQLDVGIARMRPQDPEYEGLRQSLARMREVVQRGGWAPVPEGKPLKKGDRESPARLAALRARLAMEGLLAAQPGDTGSTYDERLAQAVSQYQARHSIVVDGMLGEETVKSMNVPAEYRLGQIAANMERHRWLPRNRGHRFILVNVPAFRLQAFDSTGVALEMKVIVGEEYEGRSTPVFSDSMETVVFRPYWNVTPTIQEKEIEPLIARDPGYMARNNYEWWSDGGVRRIRQRPGPKNSLGLVKFMFPNSFNIYLHDTPSRSLFQKDVRAFSHGCIRLEKPAELAQWVLGWDAGRVEAAMEDGSNNRSVRLPRKLPVYIAYFTTFMKDGQLHFGNDLYSRDDQLVAAMMSGARPSAVALHNLEVLRKLVD